MSYRLRTLQRNTEIHPCRSWLLKPAALFLLWNVAGYGQTKVDLKNQTQNVDFSQAPTTRPVKTGTTLPATPCSAGELFYKTDAAAGQNIYGCTNSTWHLQGDGGTGGGGGGASVFAELTDLKLSFSGSTWTIGAGKAAFGDVAASFSSATLAEIDPDDSGTIYFCVDYNNGSPRLVAAIPAAFTQANYTPNGMTRITGTSCPSNSRQLGTGQMTSGTGTLTSDDRPAFSYGPVVKAGTYLTLTVTDSGQSRTADIDTTAVPRFFTGTGAPGAVSGSRIGSFYFRTDTSQLYACFQPAADCTTEAAGNWVALN